MSRSYQKLYDQPSSKSVVHANLCKTTEAVEVKNISFIVNCGDLSVCSLLVELCSKNEE